MYLLADLLHFGASDFPSKNPFKKCFKIVFFSLRRRDPVFELQFPMPLRVVLLCFATQSPPDRIVMAASRLLLALAACVMSFCSWISYIVLEWLHEGYEMYLLADLLHFGASVFLLHVGLEAVWSVGREECSVKCEVWRKQWEVRSVKCGVWSLSLECEARSVKCEVWSVRLECEGKQWEVRSVKCGLRKCEVWSVECEVSSLECEECGVKCEVWSVKFEVWSAKSAVWSVECEVWSLECEECSVKCGVWSVKTLLRLSLKKIKRLSREGHGRDRVSLNYRSFIFGKLPPPACPGLC